MYHQQQLVVATFDAGTEATVLVDYAATAALSAKYVLTCGLGHRHVKDAGGYQQACIGPDEFAKQF